MVARTKRQGQPSTKRKNKGSNSNANANANANSGLALIWLAATVGLHAKSHSSSSGGGGGAGGALSRQAIQAVDLKDLCLTIQLQTSPPKPTLSRQQQQQQPILTPAPAPTPPAPPTMALRLSAAYLVGLSRILNQQYTYTLTDTSKLHSSIVAAFNSSSSSSAASLTMLAPEARFDAITLQTDLGGGADGDGDAPPLHLLLVDDHPIHLDQLLPLSSSTSQLLKKKRKMVGWLADSLITENNTQQSSSSIMSRSQQLQQQDHSGSAVDSTSLSAVSVMSGGARMMHQQRVFDVASINLPVGGGGGGAGSYSSAAIGGGDAASYLDMMFDDFDMGGGIGGGGGTSVSSGILSSSQQQQMQSRLARPSSSIDFIQVRDDHRLASSIGVAAADGEPNEFDEWNLDFDLQPDLQQDVDIRGYDDMPYDYQDMVGVAVGDELVPDIQEKELERIVAVGGGAAGARQDELESEASERVVAAVIRQPRKRAKKATGGKGGGRGRKRRHGVEMLDEKIELSYDELRAFRDASSSTLVPPNFVPAFATKLPTDPDAIWDSVIAGLASNTPAIGSHALGSRLMKVWERVSGIKEPYVLTGGVSVGRKDVAKSAFVLANGQRRSKRRLMEVSLGTLRSGITGRLGRGRGGGDAGGVGDNVVVGDFDNQLLHQQNQQGQQQFDYDFDILGQDFPAFDENQDLELGRHRPSSAATAAYTPLVLRGVEDDGAARPRSSLSLAASLRLARSGVALSSADGSGFPLMLPGGDSAASSSNRRPSGSGRYSDILPRSNNMDDYLFEPLQDATGADILDDHLGSSVDGGCGLVGESFDDDRGTVMSSMLGGAGAGYVGKDGRVYDASASVEKEIVGFFNYAKEIMQGARTDFVHLFDILGVPEAAADAEDHEAMQGFAAVPRSQACKVFSIALVLATRGEVDLIQEAPYADIKMVLSGKQLQIKEESDNEDEVEEGEGQNGGGEDEEVLRDVDMAEVAR